MTGLDSSEKVNKGGRHSHVLALTYYGPEMLKEKRKLDRSIYVSSPAREIKDHFSSFFSFCGPG
jgi:hypothetical protein